MKLSLIAIFILFSLGVFAQAPAKYSEAQLRCHKIARKFIAAQAKAQMDLMKRLEAEGRISGNDLAEYDRLSAPSLAIVNTIMQQCKSSIDSEQIDLMEKTLLLAEITANQRKKGDSPKVAAHPRSEVECHSEHQQTLMLEKNFRALATSMAEIGPCTESDVKRNKNIVGFKCRTSVGTIFERVSKNNFGESWKGPDGLIWSDSVGTFSGFQPANACQKLGGTLPSRADFERGEANGFREVMPSMKEQKIWTSTNFPVPGYSYENEFYYRYFFDGGHGRIDQASRDFSFSVRCVAR